jgi:teichuronic acid biosynthesis glycosyltransferase TuaH
VPDFVVYGTVPWDSPWLTEHNLAAALARRHRVLFVEPPLTPLTPVRYGWRRESLRQVRRLLPPLLNRAGVMHGLRLLALPPLEHPRARRASVPLLRAQVARAKARLGLRDPVVLAFHPVVDLLSAAEERACVYLAKDLLEAGGDLIGKDGAAVAQEERRMCARSDFVCVVTRQLQETFASRGIEADLLPHGFHAELAPLYEHARRPPEYDRLSKPILGYAGRIDGRLDFAAIGTLADRYRDGSVVLIGPVSPRLPRAQLDAIEERPNVHLLGSRARQQLPPYLRHADCLLMPYRDGDWLRHGSPLKLWDSLYAGPPVVGSGCIALTDHPLVHYAASAESLPDTVALALRENGAGRQARRTYALANTWDRRAEDLEHLLDSRLGIRS